MIASLPMYLRPETRAAHEALWAGLRDALRDRGVAAPDVLDHDAPIHDTWSRPDLVFGQICNLPFRAAFHDRVTLIAAPDHQLPGAEPGHYYSVLVARADDLRDAPADFAKATLAVNAPDSQSGWAAPWLLARDAGFAFSRATLTGSHAASARAVAEGRADLAAIDAVTWEMLTRHDRWTDGLRVIARSGTSPALSYITATGSDPAPIRAALRDAITAISPDDRTALCLHGIVEIPLAAYTGLPIPPAPPI